MLLCYSSMRGGRGAARSRCALSMKMWTAPGCMGKSPAALRLLPVATVALLVRPGPSSTLAVRASCAICGAGASPSSSLSSCHTGRRRPSCSELTVQQLSPKAPTRCGRNALARSFRTAARPARCAARATSSTVGLRGGTCESRGDAHAQSVTSVCGARSGCSEAHAVRVRARVGVGRGRPSGAAVGCNLPYLPRAVRPSPSCPACLTPV